MLARTRKHPIAAISPILSTAVFAWACSSSSGTPTQSEEASVAPVATDPVGSTQMAEPSVEASAEPVAQGPVMAAPSQAAEEVLVDLPADEVENDAADEEEPEAEVSTMVTEECAATEVTATDTTTVQPADIIFAIDTSRSMTEEIDFVQTYMNEFSQQIIDSGVDVRVILIGSPQPEGGNQQPMMDDGMNGGFQGGFGQVAQGICIDAPLGSGSCPLDENQPVYIHVENAVGSNDGLNVILDTYSQWQEFLRPDASKSFVIVSDDDATDEPNNSAAAFTANLQALDAEMFAEWTFNGIFCGMDCEASAAIGLVFQDLVAQTGGVEGELCLQDFQPVFDRLAEQIITDAGSQIACEWELPTPPTGQTFSVDFVQVTRTTPAAGAVSFERVPGIADCALSSWYFDDPVNPTKILACPETCEAMQNEDGGSIDVTFGCELIAGCASSSASAVMAAADGTGCDFPLPMPPDGVVIDVSTVNVRYTTPSGFGVVLGVVDGADECANVEAGWYFDDPDEPTTISLCPETCGEYEAGNLSDVQAVFGCDAKPALRAK